MRSAEAPPSEFQRLLGTYSAGKPGPMIVVMGGVHGNEPSGVHALHRVLARLQQERLPLAGKIVAIAGNLAALSRGERFLNRDLNRRWQHEQLEQLRARDRGGDSEEDREQRELLHVFDQCSTEARGPVLFVDLHTSSADGPPFCCLGDTLPNRRIALALEVPVILGLEETVDGAVLEYWNERGLAGVAVEGGRHDLPHTVDRLEAAVWLALVAAGALVEADVTDLDEMRRKLRHASRGAAPVVEIREHHRITPADQFVMEPGFASFQKVRKGQLLARDRNGEIRASEAGRILLPLYQGLGEDGFFLCRDVSVFWLWVAKFMRQLGLGAVLPLLPGVRRHPTLRNTLLANPKVARFFVRQIFHLLGYRRCRPDGNDLAFERREVAEVTRQLPWRGQE